MTDLVLIHQVNSIPYGTIPGENAISARRNRARVRAGQHVRIHPPLPCPAVPCGRGYRHRVPSRICPAGAWICRHRHPHLISRVGVPGAARTEPSQRVTDLVLIHQFDGIPDGTIPPEDAGVLRRNRTRVNTGQVRRLKKSLPCAAIPSRRHNAHTIATRIGPVGTGICRHRDPHLISHSGVPSVAHSESSQRVAGRVLVYQVDVIPKGTIPDEDEISRQRNG